jgi:type II secretory pathway component PulF
MGQFSYSAKDKSGIIQKGDLFAPDRAAAAAALAEKGLTPILVKEVAPKSKGGGAMGKLGAFGSKVKLQDKGIKEAQNGNGGRGQTGGGRGNARQLAGDAPGGV